MSISKEEFYLKYWKPISDNQRDIDLLWFKIFAKLEEKTKKTGKGVIILKKRTRLEL